MKSASTRTYIMLAFAASLLLLCGCAVQKAPVTETATTLPAYATPSTLDASQSPLPVALGEYSAGKNRITYAGDVAGKPAYIISKDAKKTIFYDGKETGSQYDSALMPTDVSGKLFYAGVRNNKYYAVYDGNETGEGFFRIWSPGEHAGKLIYIGEKVGKSVIVLDGKEMNSSYDYIWSYNAIGGKLAYTASMLGETYTASKIQPQTAESRKDIPPAGVKSVIYYDGAEIGGNYDTALFPRDVDGKMAYVALKNGKKFIVYGGIEGTGYDEIYEPLIYDGRLAYVAQDSGKSVLVYGETVAAEYKDIDGPSLREIGGKLFFRAADAAKNASRYFAVYGKEEFGKHYDNVLSFAASGDEVAYVAARGKQRFVVYKGAEIGKSYDYIESDSLAFARGKLTFIAQNGGEWLIVKEE